MNKAQLISHLNGIKLTHLAKLLEDLAGCSLLELIAQNYSATDPYRATNARDLSRKKLIELFMELSWAENMAEYLVITYEEAVILEEALERSFIVRAHFPYDETTKPDIADEVEGGEE